MGPARDREVRQESALGSADFQPFRDFEHGVDVYLDPSWTYAGGLMFASADSASRLVLIWPGKEAGFFGSSS